MSLKRVSSFDKREEIYHDYLDCKGDPKKIEEWHRRWAHNPEGYNPQLETRSEIEERKLLSSRLPDFKKIERECDKPNNEEKCIKLKEEWNRKHKIPFEEFFFDYYSIARGLKTRKHKKSPKKSKSKSKSKKHNKTKWHKSRKSKKSKK